MCHFSGYRPVYLLLVLVAGCASEAHRPPAALEPPVVPFEEVFTLTDTLRIDSELVVGVISHIDANADGELLVSDEFSDAVYLVDRHGHLQQTFRPADCLYKDHTWLGAAKFGPEGTVIYHGGTGLVVFDAEGRCVASDPKAHDLRAACPIADSIYTLSSYARFSRRETVAYSLNLEVLGTTDILQPKFPRLNSLITTNRGFAMDCFADGPYYTMLASADAWPVFGHPGFTPVHPPFFDDRTHDTPKVQDREVRILDFFALPANIGVLALEMDTRIVIYWQLRSKWRGGQYPDHPKGIGLGIASNTNQFAAISTVSPIWPRGAGDGYMYSVGDNEQLPNGDVGNPVVLRYKFIPPSDATP